MVTTDRKDTPRLDAVHDTNKVGTMKSEMIWMTNQEYMSVWHAFTRLAWLRELGKLGIGEDRITYLDNDDTVIADGRKLTIDFERLITQPTRQPEILEWVVCPGCKLPTVVPFSGFGNPIAQTEGCAFCTDPELREVM